MKANPRYGEFLTTLQKCAEAWGQPWIGDSWRFQDIDFPTGKDILSGKGAQLRGGRLNFRGSFPVVYGSTDEVTALVESSAHSQRYGLVVRKPRILVAIELRLQRALDLRVPDIQGALNLSLKELQCENWGNLQYHGTEALSQALGRAVFDAGFEAILIPSFAHPAGTNIAWFPKNALRGSTASIHEGSKLPQSRRR